MERSDLMAPLLDLDAACDEEAISEILWHPSQSATSLQVSSGSLPGIPGGIISVDDPLMPTLSPQQPAPSNKDAANPACQIPAKSITPELSIKSEPQEAKNMHPKVVPKEPEQKQETKLKAEINDSKAFSLVTAQQKNNFSLGVDMMEPVSNSSSDQVCFRENVHCTWLQAQIRDTFKSTLQPMDTNSYETSLEAWDRQNYGRKMLMLPVAETEEPELKVPNDSNQLSNGVNGNNVLRNGHFGKSLASSSGSGHLGGVELSLMLPTPPSQESVVLSEASPSMLSSATGEDGVPTSISPIQLMKNNLESLAKQCPLEFTDTASVARDWNFSQPRIFCEGMAVGFRSSGQELKAIISMPKKYMENYMKNFNGKSESEVKPLTIEPQGSTRDEKASVKNAPPHFSPQLMEVSSQVRQQKTDDNNLWSKSANNSQIDVIACVHSTGIQMGNESADNVDNQAQSKPFTKLVRAILEVINRCSKANAHLLLAMHQILTQPKANSLEQEYLERLDTVNGLQLNLLLQDSIVNLFKDHNFDSCNICVCKTSVWSREVGLYLPSPSQDLAGLQSQSSHNTGTGGMVTPDPLAPTPSTDPNSGGSQRFDSFMDNIQAPTVDQCHCAFSAVVNQRYACHANLFYEDEVEVTGVNLISALAEEPELQEVIHSSPINESIVMPANLTAFPHKSPPPPGSNPQLWEAHNNSMGILLSPYTQVPLPSRNHWPAATLVEEPKDSQPMEVINLRVIAGQNLKLLFKWSRGPSLELTARLLNQWIDYENMALPHRTRESIMEFKEICALMIATISQCVVQCPINHPPPPHEFMHDSMYSPNQPNLSPRKKMMHMQQPGRNYYDHRIPTMAPRFDESNRSNGIFVHPAFVFKSALKVQENISDHVLFLDTIKPLLQEAISSTRALENSFTVDGPLTWKNFHQLAGRGTDETSKPQPVPQFRFASADHQSCLLSPFAVSQWEHLALSPLSFKKRLAYAVIAPADQLYSNKPFRRSLDDSTTCKSPPQPSLVDASFVQTRMTSFFSELSSAYDACQLGQHLPYFKPQQVNSDAAFIPVAINTPSKGNVLSAKQRKFVQQLTLCLREGDKSQAAMQELLTFMMIYLQSMVDRTSKVLLERGVWQADGKSRLSQLFPLASDPQDQNQIFKPSKTCPANGQGSLSSTYDVSLFGKDEDTYLVLYLVEPFTFLSDLTPGFSRVLVHTIIQWGVNEIMGALPSSWRPRVHIQILSLTDFLPQASEWMHRVNAIALDLYQQIDRYLQPSLVNANRTLTGFGPSADRESISAQQEMRQMRHVYSPAYTLHRNRDFNDQWKCPPSEPLDRSSVLFVCYCLSEDQQWLMASCCDDTGQMLEETVISLRTSEALIPIYARAFKTQGPSPPDSTNQSGSHVFSMRRYALSRLWDFVLHTIAGTCIPWRIVVSRVGRLGHGEMKAWNGLLSRGNLQEVNHSLENNCLMCGLVSRAQQQTACPNSSLPPSAGIGGSSMHPEATLKSHLCTHQIPSIISACLVSIEPQSTFKIYADRNGLAVHSNVHRGNRQHVYASQVGGVPGKLHSSGVNNMSMPGNSSGKQESASSVYSLPVPLQMQGLPLGLPSAPALYGPWELPSTTHILVFPTSAFAGAQSDQDIDQDAYLEFDFNADDEMIDMFPEGLDALNSVSAVPGPIRGSGTSHGTASGTRGMGLGGPGMGSGAMGDRGSGFSTTPFSSTNSGPDSNIFSFAKHHQGQLSALSTSSYVSAEQKRRYQVNFQYLS
ncbi:hypothetical protein Ciccas_001927 [Cichlidogyrus casuarinus]|uniref:Mediator of RNA polymerase II transcription subunit 13 n=1 Tax=Cichlidogyrus casuarinus TaxID=1844966 RepID=A0ABD2QIS3_9PLAT